MSKKRMDNSRILLLLVLFDFIFFGICLTYAFFKKDYAIVFVAFVCGFLIIVGYFIYTAVYTAVKAGRALRDLSIRIGASFEARPQRVEIPEIFYGQGGIIQFKKVKNLVKTNSGLDIFINSYWLQRRGESVLLQHLYIFFPISPVQGYHRIAPKIKLPSLLTKIEKFIPSGLLPIINTGMPEIDANYYVFSDKEGEAKRILGKVDYSLKELAGEQVYFSPLPAVDFCAPAWLEIHITDKYALARMTIEAAPKLDQLYPIFEDIKKSLTVY